MPSSPLADVKNVITAPYPDKEGIKQYIDNNNNSNSGNDVSAFSAVHAVDIDAQNAQRSIVSDEAQHALHTTPLYSTTHQPLFVSVYPHAPSWLKAYSSMYDSAYAYITNLNYDSIYIKSVLTCISFASGMNAVFAAASNVEADHILGNTPVACIRAAALSFAMGFSTLFLFMLIQPTQLFVALPRLWSRRHKIKLFYLLGGLFGCGYVTLAIYLSATQGFGPFFAGSVAGATATSIFIDKIGFLSVMPQRNVTGVKIFGLLLIIAGLILFQNFDAKVSTGTEAGNIIAGLANGALLVFQAPLNRAISNVVDSVLVGTVVSFGVGLIGCAIMFGFTVLVEPFTYNTNVATWTAFLGGPLGNVTVSAGILLPPKLGLSTFFVANIAGQLTCSVILTYTNALNGGKHYDDRWMQIVAVPVATLGAALISYENYKLERAQKLKKIAERVESQRQHSNDNDQHDRQQRASTPSQAHDSDSTRRLHHITNPSSGRYNTTTQCSNDEEQVGSLRVMIPANVVAEASTQVNSPDTS